jgi:MoxR-like ATPase
MIARRQEEHPMTTPTSPRGQATDAAQTLVRNVEQVVVGKHDVVTAAVTVLLARGHLLIEDVPGVGKTVLAKALARSIDGPFARIQFTADLLPSDITGVSIFRQQSGEFVFRPGPVFTAVLLGDEINRATPRTQSSLLEAMEENQVTVDGIRHDLNPPFFVMATQNPIELEGTYPLPFAQMDRFMARLRIGYLPADEEQRMIRERVLNSPLDRLDAVMDCARLVALQEAVRAVTIADDLVAYVVGIVQRTRELDRIEYGASPRSGLDLVRYSQATALLAGRDYVMPDDIKAGARVVLAHRLIVKKGTRHATVASDALVEEAVAAVEVPV